MATLQPMTPLQPLIQASMKPPSPLHAPNKGPLKPPSPLRPKTAPKTLISHPQRRWRFQSHTGTSEQRRWRFQTHTGTSEQRRQGFHTTGQPGLQGLTAVPAGDDATHRQPNLARNLSRSFFETPQKRCNSNAMNSMFELVEGELRAKLLVDSHSRTTSRRTEQHQPRRPHRYGGRRRGLAGQHTAPRHCRCEGCRRVRRARLGCRWAAAGPGRASSRRAERSSRRGRLAGGPPPTGASRSPARTPDGARNTSGAATSNKQRIQNAHPEPGGHI